MGKKGKWFNAVKRVFSCESKENKRKNKRSIDFASSSTENAVVNHSPREEVKLIEAEIEQNRHAYSVALATAAAAEAAAAAANAAAEVVRLTAGAGYLGKSKEEIAAIKIQTAFRGYLARRALRALRGLVRLKSLIVGPSVKRQAATTLKYMQTVSHVQSEIRARRIRMSEHNSGLQRQIQQKREKELLEKLRVSVGEDWDDSMQSKERIEANIQHRQEAAVRRERALAYAYTHQQTWRNTSNSANQTFMDPNNLHWGWSWLERWMASRPWDPADKESNSDRVSVKGTTSVRGNAKMNSSPTPHKQSRPPSRQSPSTPKSKAAAKFRPASPRGTTASGRDDDSKSINSAQSDRCRRHSIAGSSVRDDESLASSSASAIVRSYMASTESARARSRLASLLGEEKVGGSAKKRLSFSGSPGGPRRHSEPPRVDISPMKDLNTAS